MDNNTEKIFTSSFSKRTFGSMTDKHDNIQQASILDDNSDIIVTKEDWWIKLGRNGSSIAPVSFSEDCNGANLNEDDIIQDAFLPDSCEVISPIPDTMNDINTPLFSTPNISLESNVFRKKLFGKILNQQIVTPFIENTSNLTAGGPSTFIDSSINDDDITMPPPPTKKALFKQKKRSTEFREINDDQKLQQNKTKHRYSDLDDITVSPQPITKKTFFKPKDSTSDFKNFSIMNDVEDKEKEKDKEGQKDFREIIDDQKLQQNKSKHRYSDLDDITVSLPLVKKTFFKPKKSTSEFKDFLIMNDEENKEKENDKGGQKEFGEINDDQKLQKNKTKHRYSDLDNITVSPQPITKKTFFKPKKSTSEFKDFPIMNDEGNKEKENDKGRQKEFGEINDEQKLQQNKTKHRYSDLDDISVSLPLVKKTFFKPKKSTSEFKDFLIMNDEENKEKENDKGGQKEFGEINDDQKLQKNKTKHRYSDLDNITVSPQPITKKTFFKPKKSTSEFKDFPIMKDEGNKEKEKDKEGQKDFREIIDDQKLQKNKSKHRYSDLDDITVSPPPLTKKTFFKPKKLTSEFKDFPIINDEENKEKESDKGGQKEFGEINDDQKLQQNETIRCYTDLDDITVLPPLAKKTFFKPKESIAEFKDFSVMNGEDDEEKEKDNFKTYDERTIMDTVHQSNVSPEHKEIKGNTPKNSDNPTKKQFFVAHKSISRFIRQYEAILDSSESENDCPNLPKLAKTMNTRPSRASSLSSRISDYYDNWQLLPSSTMIEYTDGRQSGHGSPAKRSKLFDGTHTNPLNVKSNVIDSPGLNFSNKNNQSTEVMRQVRCISVDENSLTENDSRLHNDTQNKGSLIVEKLLKIAPRIETTNETGLFSQNDIQVEDRDRTEFSLAIEKTGSRSPLDSESSLIGRMVSNNLSQTTIDRMFEEEFQSKRTNPPVRRSSVKNIDRLSDVTSQLEESILANDNSSAAKYLNKSPKTSAENTALSQSEIEQAFIKKSQKLRLNPPVRHSMAPATLKDTSPHGSQTSPHPNILEHNSLLNDDKHNDKGFINEDHINENVLQDCSEVRKIEQIIKLNEVNILCSPEIIDNVENLIIDSSSKDISEIKDNMLVEISLEKFNKGQTKDQEAPEQIESLDISIANDQINVLDKEEQATNKRVQDQNKVDHLSDPEHESEEETKNEPQNTEELEDEEDPEVEEEEVHVTDMSNEDQSDQEIDNENEEHDSSDSSEDSEKSNEVSSESIEHLSEDEPMDKLEDNASNVKEVEANQIPRTVETPDNINIGQKDIKQSGESKAEREETPSFIRKENEEYNKSDNKENTVTIKRLSIFDKSTNQDVPHSLATEKDIVQSSSILRESAFRRSGSNKLDASKKRESSTVMLDFEPKRKVIKCNKITDPREIDRCLYLLRMDLAEKNRQAKENIAKRFNPENRSKNLICRYKRPVPDSPTKKCKKTKKKPAIIIGGQVYKKPKLYKPGVWATKKLYNFLNCKLQDKYGFEAAVRAERFVKELHEVIKHVMKDKSEPSSFLSWQLLEELKKEMAILDIIETHFDFYIFVEEFMTREFRYKAIPNMLNGFKLPEGGINQAILKNGANL